MARRVVNVDTGNSGSLSSRFASIEKTAATKPKPAASSRAVQAVAPSKPLGGGVNKRGQQSPRGARGSSKALDTAARGARGGRGGNATRVPGQKGRDTRGQNGSRGARGGRGGRGGKPKKPLSKDDLDKELDSYMFKDEKIGQDLLDKELEDYMANRGNGSNGADAQTD